MNLALLELSSISAPFASNSLRIATSFRGLRLLPSLTAMSTTRVQNRGLAAKIPDHIREGQKDDPPMAYAYPLPEYNSWPASKYMG